MGPVGGARTARARGSSRSLDDETDRWRLLAPAFPGCGYSATPESFTYTFDGYEDQLGPQYAGLKAYWANPTDDGYRKIRASITKEEFEREFLNDVRPELAARIPPDLWDLHWALMSARRRDIAADVSAGLRENVAWLPRNQAYLREHRPETMILWGPQDGYIPEGADRAWLRNVPDAELHLLDGGHWLLETNLDEAVALTRAFLMRLGAPAHPRRARSTG